MAKERIDKLLVERGLAENRTRAQAMILAGQVLIRDQRVDKPGQMVASDTPIRIKGEPPRYVGRGGLKLEAALSRFGIDVEGKMCIDIGASTGGFTDCLLQHGAKKVWAVDVGHGQIAWQLRQDPRVIILEGINARYLDESQFPVKFDCATIDVSFISLAKILPAVRSVINKGAEVVALVKPQFEVGKGEVGKGGIVTDSAKHRRVLYEIAEQAAKIGLKPVEAIESPVLGSEGNREFFLHLVNSDEGEEPSLRLKQSIDALTPE